MILEGDRKLGALGTFYDLGPFFGHLFGHLFCMSKWKITKMMRDCRIVKKLLEREPFFAIRTSPGAHAQRKEGDTVRDQGEERKKANYFQREKYT